MENSTNIDAIECGLMFTDLNDRENINGMLLMTVYAFTAFFAITLNLTAIFQLVKSLENLTRLDYLFLFLSSNDLLVGVVLLPFQIYLVNKSGDITCFEAGFEGVFNILPNTVSGLTTFLIANDRYMCIKWKHLHETFVTASFVKGMIILSVFISTGWSVLFVHASHSEYYSFRRALLLSFGIFMGIILAEVIIINLDLSRHIKGVAKHTQKCYGKKCTLYRRHVNKTISIISIVLVIAYAPVFVTVTFGAVYYGEEKVAKVEESGKYFAWAFVPMNINAALNALIYIWRSKLVRRSLKNSWKNYTKGWLHEPSTNSELCHMV